MYVVVDLLEEKIDVTHDFFHQKKLMLHMIFPPEKIDVTHDFFHQKKLKCFF
jgi:hypothetical protein